MINKYVTIKMGYSNIRIELQEILWVKSDNYYVEIITTNEKYIYRTSLYAFLQTLGNPKFQRVHRSYVVNINKIIAFDSKSVTIKKHKIPVSRKYKDSLLALLHS